MSYKNNLRKTTLQNKIKSVTRCLLDMLFSFDEQTLNFILSEISSHDETIVYWNVNHVLNLLLAQKKNTTVMTQININTVSNTKNKKKTTSTKNKKLKSSRKVDSENEEDVENNNNETYISDHKPLVFLIHTLLIEVSSETRLYLLLKLKDFWFLSSNHEVAQSSSEYPKQLSWFSNVFKIPFGMYRKDRKCSEFSKIAEILEDAKDSLDNKVLGHENAKGAVLDYLTEFLFRQVQEENEQNLGQERNYDNIADDKTMATGLNLRKKEQSQTPLILGIHGPPGTGKTSLIRYGVAEILKRPMFTVSLGGMTDAHTLRGFHYTYEGARPGKIVEILSRSQCMNPVIFFDELDKVSETSQGAEIINTLIHITDASQNCSFQDEYIGEINIDISHVTFIFAYNDRSKVSSILLNRITETEVFPFTKEEKTIIVQEFLCKELKTPYLSPLSFQDEKTIHFLIDRTTDEPGVRRLRDNLLRIQRTLLKTFLLNNNNKCEKKGQEEDEQEEQEEGQQGAPNVFNGKHKYFVNSHVPCLSTSDKRLFPTINANDGLYSFFSDEEATEEKASVFTVSNYSDEISFSTSENEESTTIKKKEINFQHSISIPRSSLAEESQSSVRPHVGRKRQRVMDMLDNSISKSIEPNISNSTVRTDDDNHADDDHHAPLKQDTYLHEQKCFSEIQLPLITEEILWSIFFPERQFEEEMENIVIRKRNANRSPGSILSLFYFPEMNTSSIIEIQAKTFFKSQNNKIRKNPKLMRMRKEDSTDKKTCKNENKQVSSFPFDTTITGNANCLEIYETLLIVKTCLLFMLPSSISSKIQRIHVHFQYNCEKRGSSVGISLFLVILSSILNKKLRGDTICSGTIDIHGKVGRVNNIFSKIHAALFSGHSIIILPEENYEEFMAKKSMFPKFKLQVVMGLNNFNINETRSTSNTTRPRTQVFDDNNKYIVFENSLTRIACHHLHYQ